MLTVTAKVSLSALNVDGLRLCTHCEVQRELSLSAVVCTLETEGHPLCNSLTGCLLCRFYPGMDRLASADVHGHVLVHLIHDSGDEILMNHCLSLNLGQFHGAPLMPHYKALSSKATLH